MAEVQFYYSAGGREVYGPVTKHMLHGLLRDNIIDSNYFFCREGEAEWRQLDPAVLEAEPEMMEPEPEEIPVAGAEPTTSVVEEQFEGFWSTWVDIMESMSMRLFLYGICFFVPVLSGFILTSHYAAKLPQTTQTETHMVPLCSYFAGVVVGIAVAVFLFGLPFPPANRLWIRTSAMLFVGALVAAGLIR